MPKRLILCLDGSWDMPSEHSTIPSRSALLSLDPANATCTRENVSTNVRRLYDSILPRSHNGWAQTKWYDDGAELPWLGRFRDGTFGYALDLQVLQSYAYLVALYEPGDEIYLYGFSRGAYVARTLVGLVQTCGLISPSLVEAQRVNRIKDLALSGASNAATSYDLTRSLRDLVLCPDDHLLTEAYRLYRNLGHDAQGRASSSFRSQAGQRAAIAFLGVWDTVGPMGIPTKALKYLNDHRYNFHDTDLSPVVKRAYHALAIDEHRSDYDATLWTSRTHDGQTIEQRWFSGSHGDVGGTYREKELSDLSLSWIQRRSVEAGISIEGTNPKYEPNPLGQLHDSFSEGFKGLRRWIHSRFYRPVLQTGTGTEVLDESVRIRLLRDSSYRPNNEGLRAAMTFADRR
ncbi:MAG: DUF2235 domain-containing protein [Nitrospiraceae bacterium]|nr:DUF2235 domain-containing protein [Nitrospiraceae bacterium]